MGEIQCKVAKKTWKCQEFSVLERPQLSWNLTFVWKNWKHNFVPWFWEVSQTCRYYIHIPGKLPSWKCLTPLTSILIYKKKNVNVGGAKVWLSLKQATPFVLHNLNLLHRPCWHSPQPITSLCLEAISSFSRAHEIYNCQSAHLRWC